MNSPDRAVVVNLMDSVEIVRWLMVDEPDPTPEELEAIAVPYYALGGVATARVVGRWWVGYLHLSPDQLAAIGSGDSCQYD